MILKWIKRIAVLEEETVPGVTERVSSPLLSILISSLSQMSNTLNTQLSLVPVQIVQVESVPGVMVSVVTMDKSHLRLQESQMEQ